MHVIVIKLVSKDYRVLVGEEEEEEGGVGAGSCFRDAVKVSFITGRVFDCLSVGTGSGNRSVGSEARLPVSYDDFLEVSCGDLYMSC